MLKKKAVWNKWYSLLNVYKITFNFFNWFKVSRVQKDSILKHIGTILKYY